MSTAFHGVEQGSSLERSEHSHCRTYVLLKFGLAFRISFKPVPPAFTLTAYGSDKHIGVQLRTVCHCHGVRPVAGNMEEAN